MEATENPQTQTDSTYRWYRPKVYQPRMSIFWWTRRLPYVLFILRELTSVAVAIYALLLLYTAHSLVQGPAEWQALLDWLASPGMVTLHVLLLAGLLYHSITWFRITPVAVVLKVAGRRVPAWLMIAANLLLWVIASVAIVWFVISV